MMSRRDFFDYQELFEILHNLIPHGYKCYTVGTRIYAFIITPNDNVLYIQPDNIAGWDISLQYVPNREHGSGCSCSKEPLPSVDFDIINQAEAYGLNFAAKLNAQMYKNSETWKNRFWQKNELIEVTLESGKPDKKYYFIDNDIYSCGEKQPPRKVYCQMIEFNDAKNEASFYDENGNSYHVPKDKILEEDTLDISAEFQDKLIKWYGNTLQRYEIIKKSTNDVLLLVAYRTDDKELKFDVVKLTSENNEVALDIGETTSINDTYMDAALKLMQAAISGSEKTE